MHFPLEIVFHNVDRSPAVEAAVRERGERHWMLGRLMSPVPAER